RSALGADRLRALLLFASPWPQRTPEGMIFATSGPSLSIADRANQARILAAARLTGLVTGGRIAASVLCALRCYSTDLEWPMPEPLPPLTKLNHLASVILARMRNDLPDILARTDAAKHELEAAQRGLTEARTPAGVAALNGCDRDANFAIFYEGLGLRWCAVPDSSCC